MNILLYDENEFYKNGLKVLLRESVFQKQEIEPSFIDILPTSNNENNEIISQAFADADIIFNAVDVYSNKFPRSHFKFMKNSAILINIASKHKAHSSGERFDCVKDAISVDRTISCESLISLFLNKPLIKSSSVCKSPREGCRRCFSERLSPQQENIAFYMYQGYAAKVISSTMHIRYKSVSAHKRVIMNKFNLDSEYELIHFLNNYFSPTNIPQSLSA